MRTYLLTLCGGGVLCALAERFLSEKGVGQAARLAISLVVLVVALKPLNALSSLSWEDISFEFSDYADQAVTQGQMEAQNSMAQIIKAQTEAYILEKANEYGVSLTVTVTLSQDTVPAPVAVELKGNVSPYAKKQLTAIIAQQLGIAEEDQKWT